MISIMLAKVDIGEKPIFLVMDEDNRLSYVADNGNRFQINAKTTSLALACQLAEQAIDLLPGKTAVNWLFNVHKRKLECLARETGKNRDDVYRIVIAEALAREEKRDIKTRGDLKRRVSMEVRLLPLLINGSSKNDDDVVFEAVKSMGKLTPQELAQMFPAEKRYDGGDDFKDYFSSTEFLNSLEDKPMGAEGVFNFMWDYMNPQLMKFNVLAMKTIDSDRKRQGKPSMGEVFAKEMGIPVYRKTTDADGNLVLRDDDGQAIPLS